MRVHFEIPPVEDDSRARDAIVERDFVGPNRAGQLIALKDALPRQPESVDRAVPNSGIEMVNPVVSWIRLTGSLGSEPASEQHGNEQATRSSHRVQVCSYRCAVSRILASVPS